MADQRIIKQGCKLSSDVECPLWLVIPSLVKFNPIGGTYLSNHTPIGSLSKYNHWVVLKEVSGLRGLPRLLLHFAAKAVHSLIMSQGFFIRSAMIPKNCGI